MTTALAADINPGGNGSSPSEFAEFGGLLYMRASDANGAELWRYDGAAAALAADINPGPESSSPYDLVVHAGALYLFADDGVHGYESWVTDGANTVLFADILQGSDSSEAYEATEFGDSLYLAATDGAHGSEMWRFAPPAAAPAPGSGAGTGSAAAVDRQVTVRVLGKRLRVNRRGVARVRLHCPPNEASPPCRGRVILRTAAKLRLGKGKAKRRVVLGRAGFAIAADRTKVVKLRLGKAKQRLLKRNPRARKLQAIVRASDAAGNRRALRKGLAATLRR